MIKQDYLDRLIYVIEKGHKHEHYKRTVEVAQFARQIMTGDDQKELVVAYKPSEDAEQKEQRFRLYNSRTAYVANKIYSQFNEVERVEAVVDNISYTPENKQALASLTERIETYKAKKSLKKYVHEAIRRLNFYDPNAWIVNEFRVKDKLQKPYSYPVEFYSNDVYDYGYEYDELQYLLVAVDSTIRLSENQTEKVKQYTIYGIGHAFRMVKESIDSLPDLDKININNTVYTIEYFETKYQSCPAVQVGYLRDAHTNWATFVTPLEPARHIFLDLINNKSEYDLHKAIHGFIQKFAYAERCTHRDIETNDRCNGGKMQLSGAKCGACNGTGKRVHTTVQDVILIDLPETKEEQIPLRDFIYYAEIPKHIIDGFREDIKSLEIDVSYAIFNKDTFSKDEVASTATEVRLNKQSVYNVLYPFGVCVSGAIVDLTRLVADAAGILQGLTVNHGMPKDYKLDSIEELIDQRGASVIAGTPYDITAYFDLQIIAKQNQDNPVFIEQVKAQEKFRPFRDKSKEEIIYIISTLQPTDPDRVLYTYFDKIFTKIWETKETEMFHSMKYLNQKAILDREVALIIAEITPPETQPTVLTTTNEQVQ